MKIRTLACGLALCAVAGVCGLAHADSIKRADLPEVQGVTLIDVKDGKLQYRSAAGDREAPLDEVEAIGIDTVPELAAGQAALAEGQLRAAQRSLKAVWESNRDPWVRHFAGFYLMQVYDARNQPVDASAVFAKLGSEGADVFFLSRPPVASLAEADDNQKQRIGQQILAVANATRGEHRRLMQAYLTRVVGEGGPGLPEPPGGQDDAQAARAKAKVMLPASVWALADRRGEAQKWAVIDQLAAGDFQAAHDTIKPMLNAPGDLAPKLFIYGRSLLGLAEQAEDPDEAQDLYRDAGLALMRIVVHFNRPGQVNPLVAPAQVEVAYLHKKIGRDDIHDRILFGAENEVGVNLVIDDPKAYPYYRNRYYQIIGQTPPAPQEP